MTTPPSQPRNPYVGPRSFQIGERIYGRKREANQLINLIVAERIVLLHSPSGAGKTSLIQAALIPRLEKMRFHVLPVVRVNLDVSDSLANGLDCNRYIFSALLSLEENIPEGEKISPDLLAKLSLADYLEKRYQPEGSSDVEVLIFDQFEEILTLDPTDQVEKQEFFKQVGEALEAPNRWALFSVRDDFVASLDPYLLWIPNRMSVNFRLDLLGTAAARRAIREPARSAGVDFEDDAAEGLVDDLRRVRVQQPDGSVSLQLGPHVEPVQLQVVCFRIWEDPRPDQTRITADDLEEFDQVDQSLVDGSLADYYNLQVITTAKETGTSERAIREWFDRRLITEQGVRGTVLMGSETSGGLDNNAIKLLVDAHLVRAEKRGGATWYELSHDRLLEPVRKNNTDWYNENLSLLQRQADLWNEEGRKAGLLLVGVDLDDAQQWSLDNKVDLTEVEKDFLNASLERRERRARERALKQERLEAAELLAAEKTKSARRARMWTVAVGIIGLLFLCLAVASFWLFIRNTETTNFIRNIEACEGSDINSCLAAADKAANEENYLLLVVNTCDEGMREAVQRNDPSLIAEIERACDRVVEMSDKPSSLPQLNELCDSMSYLLGTNDFITEKICQQAVRLAPEVENISQVAATCTIGQNVRMDAKDYNPVCQRVNDLVTITEDVPSLKEVCKNPFFREGFSEEEIGKICSRYFEVAINSNKPGMLLNLCYDARGIGQSQEDERLACSRAVDVAVENGNADIPRELCLDAGGLDLDAQYACEGYREVAAKIVNRTENLYELEDICSAGYSDVLPEEVVSRGCERGLEMIQAVRFDDPYLQKDMCFSGHQIASEELLRAACSAAVESAINSKDIDLIGSFCWNIQQGYIVLEDPGPVCGEYGELSQELVVSSDNAYQLKDMCVFGSESGLPDGVIRTACERGLVQAMSSDDPDLLRDLCFKSRDIGIVGDAADSACSLSAELAIQSDYVELSEDLCVYNFRGQLSAEDFQRVCAQASDEIQPGEGMQSFLESGDIHLWSYQGSEDEILIVNADSTFGTLNLIVYNPRGELIFQNASDVNNPSISSGQLQLSDNGVYVIGVLNLGEVSGDYMLELR
jgi:hypothetical protein